MWALIALAAACFQTARNAVARSLAGHISPALNSWSRFTFNLPFSTLLVVALIAWNGSARTSAVFFAYAAATAITQLLGNVALISAFNHANFAQSIILHKLEVLFTALIGAAFFSEVPTRLGWLGVVACAAGVLWMNLRRESGPDGWRRAFHLDTGALLSLTCAILLVLASFALKGATTEFAFLNPRVGAGRFEAAAHTLFHTTWIEVAILSAWLIAARPAEFRHVCVHWRRMTMIGLTGFCGSLCWFWAFSLTLVAYVKAVGQIEGVLAVLLAIYVWREAEVRRQLPGVALVTLGILLVLLGSVSH